MYGGCEILSILECECRYEDFVYVLVLRRCRDFMNDMLELSLNEFGDEMDKRLSEKIYLDNKGTYCQRRSSHFKKEMGASSFR